MTRLLRLMVGAVALAGPTWAAQRSGPPVHAPSTLREARPRPALRRGHVISPVDVRRINERLSSGRVVEVQPALDDVDNALPPELGRLADRIERLPSGRPIVIVEIEDDGTVAAANDGDVAASGGDSGSSIFDAPAVVFEQRADSGFVLTNKDDEGNFIANQLYFGNGFLPGDRISGYDLLIYTDPAGGPASVKVSLWDGDPLGIVDTQCADPPAPIPGTTTTFTDLPPAKNICPAIGRDDEPSCLGLFRLRATLPEIVPIDCVPVWMVLEVEEGCKVGWRLAGSIPDDPTSIGFAPPSIGFANTVKFEEPVGR